jgi:hypothetical protein
MPSVPGSLEVIMHIHAGTVIGGVMDSSGPHRPFSRSFVRFGISSVYSSKMCSGGAQSRPMTMTFCFFSLPGAPDELGAETVSSDFFLSLSSSPTCASSN